MTGCRQCGRTLGRRNQTGLCRSHSMARLHADPAFAERHRARLRAMHADPVYARRHSAMASARMRAMNSDPRFNPLVALKQAERADYDTLTAHGYSRCAALAAIGRADLAVVA